jgi:hypothetical protein
VKKKQILIFTFLVFSTFSMLSQEYKSSWVKKIHIYRTINDLLNNKFDSICSDIDYNYGNVKYIDKKTNKKIKFHLIKDSSFFAVRLFNDNATADRLAPIYAIAAKEKKYGVFLGGSKDFYLIMYGLMSNAAVVYDNKNYATYFYGSSFSGETWLAYEKKGFMEKKRVYEMEKLISDRPSLLAKYVKDKNESTTYRWNEEFYMIQLQYIREYNND